MRPVNMVAININLLNTLRYGVSPAESPTVPNAK